MLADAYFPLRYLIAVRLLHMKSEICQNFISALALLYVMYMKIEAWMIFTSISQQNYHVLLYPIYTCNVSYFFE